MSGMGGGVLGIINSDRLTLLPTRPLVALLGLPVDDDATTVDVVGTVAVAAAAAASDEEATDDDDDEIDSCEFNGIWLASWGGGCNGRCCGFG